MQELKEAKFPRTGKEYSLEKTAIGFNLRLIDLDDQIPAISKTFQQLLELSQSGQIVFAGFEEKKNEAELILLNCMHEEKIADFELNISDLTTQASEQKTALEAEIATLKESNAALQSELDEKKTEIENLNAIIQGLKETEKEIASN